MPDRSASVGSWPAAHLVQVVGGVDVHQHAGVVHLHRVRRVAGHDAACAFVAFERDEFGIQLGGKAHRVTTPPAVLREGHRVFGQRIGHGQDAALADHRHVARQHQPAFGMRALGHPGCDGMAHAALCACASESRQPDRAAPPACPPAAPGARWSPPRRGSRCRSRGPAWCPARWMRPGPARACAPARQSGCPGLQPAPRWWDVASWPRRVCAECVDGAEDLVGPGDRSHRMDRGARGQVVGGSLTVFHVRVAPVQRSPRPALDP